MTKESWTEIGGRKYLFAWVAFIVGSLAVFWGRFGTFSEWTTLVLGLAGFYFGANVAQKYFLRDEPGASEQQ